MKEAAAHGLIAFLYGTGLSLAMLGCLDMMAYGWLAAGIMLGVTAVMTLCSRKKWMMLALGAAALAAVLIWLTLLGGMATITDVLRAITLQLSGVTGALPMVAGETALLLTLAVGAAAFMITYRNIGSYPVLAVLILAVMLLWMSNQPEMLWYLLPAVAAAIAQTVLANHETLSLRRVLPLALAAALISFLITSGGGVTIEPMKQAADELRQKILDYFFYTEPRSVFSLATEGYYPQGQHQLGGKAEPTDHPVMTVNAPRRVYLRGSAKNEYTGREWLDTIGGRRYLWQSPRWRGIRQTTFNMDLPGGTVGTESTLTASQQVQVRMLSDSASSMFVPQRVRELNVGGDLIPYFNAASEIFTTRDLTGGDTYTVSAPLMIAGDPGLGTLVNACQSSEDPLFSQILADYTILPGHLQSQVFEIATRAAGDAQTPYEKALAIQNYLSSNFRYTLDVEPQREDVDFVSSFLLSTQEGYCTYFASAMTVLCRMMGLPARYIEGYLAEPGDNGVAYVTGMQGHAWTEVYFSGFGWLTFDATPAQHHASNAPEEPDMPEETPTPPPPGADGEPTPTPTPESEDMPPESTPEQEPTATPTASPEASAAPEDNATPEPDDQSPDRQPPEREHDWSWLWWLLPLAIAAAVTARVMLTQPQRQAARAKDETARWSIWMQALHDALRVMKLPRAANESPMAYMKRIDASRRIPMELMPVGECMALVFYGHLAPEPEETDMAREAYTAVASRLRWWQRVWLASLRAFVPAKRRIFTK